MACSEIAYGSVFESVHSDLCTIELHENKVISEKYRKFLHDNLDEYLDKFNGSGFFYVGNTETLKENFNDD